MLDRLIRRRRADKEDCESLWELLSCYADGEAQDAESARVERHLRHCRGCADALRYLRASSDSFRCIPEAEPPPALRASILLAVGEMQRARPARTWLRAPALALGTACALTLLAFFVWRTGDMGTVPAPAAGTNGPILSAVPPEVQPETAVPAATAVRPAPAPRLSERPALVHPGAGRTVAVRPTATAKRVASREKPSPRALLTAGRPRPKQRPAAVVASREARPGPVSPMRDPAAPEPPLVPTAPPEAPERPATIARSPEPATPARSPESTAPAAAVHIQLVADSNAIPADQIASLADLKRSLRTQTTSLGRFEVGRNFAQKQISVDILRKTF